MCRRGCLWQGHCARTEALANGNQPLRDFVERLVPANPLPARIAVAFRPGAFERIIQPIRMINQLRRRFALEAKHAAVGMIMVRFEARPYRLSLLRWLRSEPCKAHSSRARYASTGSAAISVFSIFKPLPFGRVGANNLSPLQYRAPPHDLYHSCKASSD